ncbi:acyl-CoA thioesterase [Microbacterium sp. Sa4CUA7]|uniref:Acyl-CoA thioesterase n=1 Tax=Microbacterium pullorum TaxID=2762236 RepID=A0ABR8S1Y9_9MICO|nr:thioesterase family protein [Microbacterium pullorum]MBD7957497.1 acyl-CoA thioesterase [Microbacterium pullorum]
MPHYGVRRPFATRWRDNDQYGHLNNVVYYEAMDTAVNAWMIAEAGLEPAASPVIALVVSSSCDFRASASFPEPLEVGIGVARLGTTSITWALGILRPGAGEPIAVGTFVHVFVDAATRRPVSVPDRVRAAVAAQLSG